MEGINGSLKYLDDKYKELYYKYKTLETDVNAILEFLLPEAEKKDINDMSVARIIGSVSAKKQKREMYLKYVEAKRTLDVIGEDYPEFRKDRSI